jgi:hypothetical protein
VSASERQTAALLGSDERHFDRLGKDSTRAFLRFLNFLFLNKERTMSPIVLILVVILMLSLLGGGYGFRSGNNVLGAGGGLLGLVLVILLILALLGRLPL